MNMLISTNELATILRNAHKNTPLFRHDCLTCIFLGHSTTKPEADLYYHPGRFNTILGRFSDEPSDYTSGLCFKDNSPVLHEAYTLAKARGLIE